jgi:hypothetical protein
MRAVKPHISNHLNRFTFPSAKISTKWASNIYQASIASMAR